MTTTENSRESESVALVTQYMDTLGINTNVIACRWFMQLKACKELLKINFL